MRREDMVLGAFILVPILCLIIPVPLFLLDLLFALNIALSMIILFNALFSKEPLDMSAFPTLLLLTTLFRLSLNVSSTRNILLIILLVITSPIWGSILVAIGGTLLGITGGLFGIAVGCVIGGIAVAGVAITILVTGTISLGLISMAAGLLMLAIGLCAAGLLVLVCGKFLPWLAKGIANLWQSLFKKKGGACA